MPYVLGHTLKSVPRSTRVRALVVWKSKGIKRVFKVRHVLQHSFAREAHGHCAVLRQGGAFLSHNSLQTAVTKSRARNTYCCILAVFRREHIPSECV